MSRLHLFKQPHLCSRASSIVSDSFPRPSSYLKQCHLSLYFILKDPPKIAIETKTAIKTLLFLLPYFFYRTWERVSRKRKRLGNTHTKKSQIKANGYTMQNIMVHYLLCLQIIILQCKWWNEPWPELERDSACVHHIQSNLTSRLLP
jgi:hypothetical protein